jgi:hypothetical protein
LVVEVNQMSMDYIRRTYGVPAKRGAIITYTGNTTPQTGRIVGSTHGLLRVRFDGRRAICSLHPTWMVEYNKTPNVKLSGCEAVRCSEK